jgi:hypothetical protein
MLGIGKRGPRELDGLGFDLLAAARTRQRCGQGAKALDKHGHGRSPDKGTRAPTVGAAATDTLSYIKPGMPIHW